MPESARQPPQGILPSDALHSVETPLFLSEILAAASEAVLYLDAEWRVLLANPLAMRISRLRPEDIGGNHWEIYPQTLGTEIEAVYRRAMHERTREHFEFFYAPFECWYDLSIVPLSTGGLVFYYTETTEKRAAEAARDLATRQLQQAEEDRDRTFAEHLEVLDAIADGVVSINRSWIMTFLNRSATELLSAAGDLVGKQLWETFPDTLSEDSPYVKVYHRAMNERIEGKFEAFYPEPLNQIFEVHVRPSNDGIVIFFRDVTARRKTEVSVQEQQDLLTSIQQAAGLATWTLDLRTGVMSFGSGSAPVFGRPFSELGHIEALRDALHPEFREQLSLNLAESSTSVGTSVHEYRMLPPDGRVLWVETRAEVVHSDGQPAQLRGMAIDITRRRQEEEASEASEARYRVLVDLNPQALWSANPAGQITYANQGFLDYLGLSQANPDGWIESFALEDHDRVIRAWQHSVRSGEPYEIEARLIRSADHAVRWWHLRGLPVRDEAGAIVQWLGVASDINEQKTFAETLLHLQGETERERAEIEALYKTAPIGLALFDLDDFHYLRLNDRQAAFFNLKPEEVVGKTLTALAPIPGLREMFDDVARGRPVINHLLEGELTSNPGEHRYWTVSYFPVYGPDGTVRAISAASLEITQQKKAEAALVQSEKLAAVGRLASSISHEINNPLEAITNLLYLTAMNEDLPEEVRGYVTTAQSELSRVSQIATQTLRFHRQAVRPTHVNAAGLVNAVLNLYQGRLNNSGISVDASFASTTQILCFENDIRQVLNNLIANAIDAMRSGGHLLARAHDTTDPVTGRPTVRITIADTGHGMSGATLKRIFEPFYTTKDLNGTGLGLWISAGIIDRHHGRMAVRSSEHPIHHGTIFSLILPIDPLGAGAGPTPSTDAPGLVLPETHSSDPASAGQPTSEGQQT